MTPSADEVKELVRRIVDDVLTDEQREVSPEPAPEPSARDRVALGADHGGYRLKAELAHRLAEAGYDVVDCGTNSEDPVDYPDYAHAVARLVSTQECSAGIVVDGAGIGSAMVANKLPGVRAALCYDLSTASNAREHNHANVLTLGGGLIGTSLAWQVVTKFLKTPWGEGRHARRVGLIDDVERRYRS